MNIPTHTFGESRPGRAPRLAHAAIEAIEPPAVRRVKETQLHRVDTAGHVK